MIITICGGGRVGLFFGNLLINLGHKVNVIDKKNYNNMSRFVKESKLILLALPMNAVGKCINDIKNYVNGKAVIDLSSSMTSNLKSLKCESAYLHPLFAPNIKSLSNMSLIYVPVRKGRIINSFLSLIEEEGASIIKSSVNEHEKMMSVVQALAHFSNILLAKTISDLKISAARLKKFQTTFFRLNMDSISRIFSQNAELYAGIQFKSQFFNDLLGIFEGNFLKLSKAVREKDYDVFNEFFRKVKTKLKPLLNISFNESKDLLNYLTSKKLRLGVLGPLGSYTDAAADFVGDRNKVYFDSIINVIKSVKDGIVDEGIIPIENSIQGTVIASLDGISDYGLFVKKAIILPINHCVAGISRNVKPSIILSHPQALAQCKKFIEKNYPKAKLVRTLSTSDAFKRIADENLTNAVAIGSEKAAKIYGLHIIRKRVQDQKNNVTKFFLIDKEKDILKAANKTLISVYPSKDVQGILYKMLGYFNKEKINLSKIESRPSKKELGNYVFYIEFDGNINEKKVMRALRSIRRSVGEVKVLGCYPQLTLRGH